MILVPIESMLMWLAMQVDVDYEGVRAVLDVAVDQDIDAKTRLEACVGMLRKMGLTCHIARKEEVEDKSAMEELEVKYPVEEFEVEVLNGKVTFWLGMN